PVSTQLHGTTSPSIAIPPLQTAARRKPVAWGLALPEAVVLRVVLVDDEAPARRYLRRMLESLDGPQVVGEADCMHSAIDIVNQHKPDAVFLDIELTRGTSFDVLGALDCQPCIVFVTAY